jgi:hypothetical protein
VKGIGTMATGCFRMIRSLGVLFLALLMWGCATYPAFQDPDIDYNGRWGTWDGGMGAYNDPNVSLYDATGGPYLWYPGVPGGYYHYWSGDDPHRYFRH